MVGKAALKRRKEEGNTSVVTERHRDSLGVIWGRADVFSIECQVLTVVKGVG